MDSILDMFTENMFKTTALTHAINETDYVPGLLGSMKIFRPRPIRHRNFVVEKKATGLRLVQTSPLGAPPTDITFDPRNARQFSTVRLAESFTLYMHEIESVRAMGQADRLVTLREEWADRASPLKDDIELTREFHRLGALQGKVLDADGSSVIYNYFDEFGIAEPAALELSLDDANANLRQECHEFYRDVNRSAKGALPPGARLAALCGDEFFDKLTTHPKVERIFENQQPEVNEFRKNLAWRAFEFGEIMWINYRGTDDNSTIAVPTATAKMFPMNAPGVFEEVLSPAEFDPWINTKGKKEYMIPIRDRDRGAWIKGELYAYPLFFCAKPQVLRRVVISA